MGLGTFTPATETVALPDGEKFAVRGLSFEDFTILLRDHYASLEVLFDRYVSEAALAKVDQDAADGALGLGDIRGVVLEALREAPALLGDVIARAADETENPHMARYLPMGVQIEAIQKIVELTLTQEGGLEKLFETAKTAWTSMAGLARSPSR